MKHTDYFNTDEDGTVLRFVSLHDHPCGGGDGGEFACYECLAVEGGGVARHDKVVYTWDVPQSPTDTFSDEDPQEYCFLPDKQAAKAKLLDTLKRLQKTTELVQSLLSALETGDYVTVRSSDLEDEDYEDYEEDEEEEDYEDEDEEEEEEDE